MRVTLRDARRADAQAIAALHHASWHAQLSTCLPPAVVEAHTLDARRAEWHVVLADLRVEGAVVRLAENDTGALVGFAHAGPARDCPTDVVVAGELYRLYIQPGVQGMGAGTALLRDMARALAHHGAGRMLVRCWAVNPACSFYERRGAVRIGLASKSVNGHILEEALYAFELASGRAPERF